jgi:iron complex transport system ATP-binding protein
MTTFHAPIQPGQWLAVVGPNAAGKSTTMRAWVQATLKQRGATGAAWLPQAPEADAHMRVGELVALGRLPHHRWWGWSLAAGPSAQDTQAIEQALQAVGMAWASDRTLNTLSGGERQRVHMARVLATQAPVLLLDEPTSHLDAPHHRQLVHLLRQHTRQGGSAITVLHELSMALMADQVLVMQAGQVVAQGARHEPALHRAIEHVFDHTLRIVQVEATPEPLWMPVPCL